jgi:hypothetical protein
MHTKVQRKVNKVSIHPKSTRHPSARPNRHVTATKDKNKHGKMAT